MVQGAACCVCYVGPNPTTDFLFIFLIYWDSIENVLFMTRERNYSKMISLSSIK